MCEENNGRVKKMMNVEIMKYVVNAYDNNEPTIGNFLIEKWNQTEGSLKLGRASANFIYNFDNGEQKQVLRIAPESERTEQQILAELDFMEYLQKKGFPVPKVILSKDNKRIEKLTTEMGSFFAVALQRCPGKIYELNELPHELFIEWGKLTATIHKLSLDYKPQNNRKRRTWIKDIITTTKYLPDNEFELKGILLELVDQINEFPKDENYGLIHYDLELDNILWNNGSYYVIDFDDSAYYHYIADLAFALEELREQNPETEKQMLNGFISGYKEIKSLPNDWLNQLDCFFSLMDILKYARTLQAYENTNPEEDPQWLADLRKRHMKKLNETKEKMIKKWNL